MTLKEFLKFIEYLKKNGEIHPDGKVEIIIDGKKYEHIMAISGSSGKNIRVYVKQ